jgi:hypothetical protein
MARISMRARLLWAAGAIALMSATPASHPAFAQGLNDIVRNLNNTMNPNDAQRRDDQARREDQFRRENQARHRDGRLEEGQYRRSTSEFRGHDRNGTDQGDYGDRGNYGQRR